MASCGMLRRVALVRTDVSEELCASIIRVSSLFELGRTLAVYIYIYTATAYRTNTDFVFKTKQYK
jgi:hypothetical protein